MRVVSQTRKLEAGLDEVGRGCLLGRVYTAMVSLPLDFDKLENVSLLIKDSKKLSDLQLNRAYDLIINHALDVQIDYLEAEDVDRMNPSEAIFLSMNNCIRKSPLNYGKVLIDGKYFKYYHTDLKKNVEHECVIKGDASYYSIACASIIAKVTRDRYVLELCEKEPELHERYGLKCNMGYSHPEVHIAGIKKHGITKYHRKTYGICKKYAEMGQGYEEKCIL